MTRWGEIKCPRCAELEAKLRKSALQEMSDLGQASEVYQAQLAAEWRDAIALMTGIVDDCLIVDAQGKIMDFEYTHLQMRIAAIRERGE